MRLSDFSIKELSICISGDKDGWHYRGGQQLVDLFNSVGFKDVYGQGFPTRKNYVKEKLQDINGKEKLKSLIRSALDPRGWKLAKNGNLIALQDAVVQMNEIIKYDDYEIVKDGNFYKVRDLTGALIEIENRFDEPEDLNELLIEEQIQKCRRKIEDGDYSGAITNARSLVENVCIKIEKDLCQTSPISDGDLNKLFNRVRKLLELDPSRTDISNSIKQVLSGLASITNGLASMRNKMSDSHGVDYSPTRHQAKLAVNAAKTLVDFLFDTHNDN